MKIEKDKINYRRANIGDIESLVDYRVRFLNELYNHPEDDETEILRKALRQYFSEAIPSNNFIAWLAEYNGKIIGTRGWLCGECQQGMGDLNLEDLDIFSIYIQSLEQEEKAFALAC